MPYFPPYLSRREIIEVAQVGFAGSDVLNIPLSQFKARWFEVSQEIGKPVLVEFGAGTCAACREMKTVLADLERSYGDRMVILDIEFGSPEGRRVLRQYGMQAIPTQLFFAADGSDLGRHLGAISAQNILEKLGLVDG